MLKTILLLISLPAVVISLSLNLYFYRYLQKQNAVVEVVDGDTFQLASGKRVRLMGVDAPEYNRCGGKEARERLTGLIKNKVVQLKEEQEETFGRSLALVYLPDQTFLIAPISLISPMLINEIILKEGWARTDYRKNSKRNILTQALHDAQQKKIGIWSPLCRETPSSPLSPVSPSCTIKANIDKVTYKKFYHLPGCKQYNQVIIEKDIGEQYFCSEEEAQKAGFKKASGCP